MFVSSVVPGMVVQVRWRFKGFCGRSFPGREDAILTLVQLDIHSLQMALVMGPQNHHSTWTPLRVLTAV